jgi:hypothetical protein
MPSLKTPRLPAGFLEWDRQPSDVADCSCGHLDGSHAADCDETDLPTTPDNEPPECEDCGHAHDEDDGCPEVERDDEPGGDGYDDVMAEELERSEWYV